MALDTTLGGSTTDSYGTLNDADAYHSALGRSAWAAATTVDRESALRRAALWLDGVYRKDYPGKRLNGRQQALEWPRSSASDYFGDAIASDSIPQEIQKAQFEAAYHELTTPDSLSPQTSSSQVVKSEKVGSVAVEYAVSEGSIDALLPIVTSVDRLLSGILTRNEDLPAFMAVQHGPV